MNALLDEFGVGDEQERDESWRYSKAALRALSQQEFAPAVGDAVLSTASIAPFDWPETRGSRLVFINGTFAQRYSDASAAESMLRIAHDNERVTLTIASTLDRPLHLVYVNVPGAHRSRWTSSCDIDVRAGNATLIEHHIGDTRCRRARLASIRDQRRGGCGSAHRRPNRSRGFRIAIPSFDCEHRWRFAYDARLGGRTAAAV